MTPLSRPVHRLLVNPSSLRGRLAKRIDRLRRRPDLDVHLTRSAEDVTEQAAIAAARGDERLLVAGGDGTLHYAIQALAGTECALGVVPTGTGNDLARSLAIERDPERALERALHGTRRRIDVGRVDDRLFATVVGVGFSAEVNRFVNERLKRLRGGLAYSWAALRTLASFRPPTVTIEHEQGVYRGRAQMAVAGNAPYFGGGMRIAPDARFDDGRLQLVIVRSISALRLLWFFPTVFRGTHVRNAAVTVVSSAGARFECDRPCDFFGDGERLHACHEGGSRLSVEPGALWLIA